MMTANTATSVFPTLRRKSTSKAADAEAKQKRETAVREAKQHVRDVVRVDWTFDPPSTLWNEESSLFTAPSDFPKPSVITGTDVRANIVQWRMREPGSSSESDSELNAYKRKRESESAKVSSSSDPYRFENPDAIKSSILERGRRRRADLEQEMKWNPGLRFFTERRDAWTGARKRRSVVQRRRRVRQQRQEESVGPLSSQSLPLSSSKERAAPSQSRSGEGSSGTDGVRASSEEQELTTPARLSKALLEDLTLSGEKLIDPTTTTEEKDDKYDLDVDFDDLNNDQDDENVDSDENNAYDYDSDDSMIPVMDAFISDSNYIRSSITPAIYTSLYSKVIVQGLTPTIPINLSDLTKALVSGWKADGQWPPKPTIPPPGSDVPARRKATSSSKKDDVTADGIVAGSHHGRKPSFSNQATNAVKKVLALSSHPFHLRRSSRSSETAEVGPTSPVFTRRMSAADGAVAGGDVPLVEEDEGSYRHGSK